MQSVINLSFFIRDSDVYFERMNLSDQSLSASEGPLRALRWRSGFGNATISTARSIVVGGYAALRKVLFPIAMAESRKYDKSATSPHPVGTDMFQAL
ncbi:MAG: hypothetical protein EXS16_14855 [Gemmataceae bacterium]|nr:hypothetical protein [Gemmataceae bacterium]